MTKQPKLKKPTKKSKCCNAKLIKNNDCVDNKNCYQCKICFKHYDELSL